MRVSVEGGLDGERIREIAKEIADNLAIDGITGICGLNIYFTPIDLDTGEQVELVNPETGNPVMWQVDGTQAGTFQVRECHRTKYATKKKFRAVATKHEVKGTAPPDL